MAASVIPYSMYLDILNRFVEIEKAITFTDAAGQNRNISRAEPRFFAPPNVGPYPVIFNWISGVTYSRPKGAQIRTDTIRVTSRILGGPATAGYAGEMEDNLNYLYVAFTEAIDNRPHLNDPNDGQDTPFQYLAPNNGVELLQFPNGTTAFVYDDPQNPYFGGDCITQVVLHVPRPRRS